MSATFSLDAPTSIEPSLLHVLSEWRQSAISDDADVVRQGASKVERDLERPQSLFGDKSRAISELWLVAGECGMPGWDGEDACAMNPFAVHTAERFIRVLPDLVPMPEITPEPDGSVGLEWSDGRYRGIAVSFGNNLRLAYAWLDGSDRGHAVARFDGETIPRRILDGIRQITRAR